MHEGDQTVLDRIMERHGLKNHDLVVASTQGLTHKQVQKGRRGRALTPRIQRKIATALSARLNETWTPAQLFLSSTMNAPKAAEPKPKTYPPDVPSSI